MGPKSGSNCGEEGLKSCMEKEQCVQRPWGGCEEWKELLWGGGKVEEGNSVCKSPEVDVRDGRSRCGEEGRWKGGQCVQRP